jgi:hypothetical protein
MHLLSRFLIFLTCISLIVLSGSQVIGQASYVVTITVQGLPANMSTRIFMDGTPNVTLSSGQSRSFNFSGSATHYVVVQSYVPDFNGQNGTRYFEKDTSWSFNAVGSHVFAYTSQYYLKVQTSYSSVGAEGWYDSGAIAQATLKDGQVDEGQDTRHVFTGWTSDASGTGLASNNIVMNGPKTAVATWKTQFHLTVESVPPGVTDLSGSGWYDAGASASISAAKVISATEDTRLRFSHWSGSFDGQSPTGAVVMDRPKNVKAHYLAQYLLAVRFDPTSIQSSHNETHAGWYDANANVQLGPAPSIISLSSVERLRFFGWIENVTSVSDPSITILMSMPRKVTLCYKTQYYVEVKSSYGSITGSGWYDKGSTAKISASSTAGTWPFSYNFASWTIDPSTGKLTQVDNSWALLVDRPYAVQANWSVDYLPLVGLVGGGTALIVALAATVVVRRKGGLFRRGSATGPLKSTGFSLPPERKHVCISCGTQISEGAVFCQKCGAAVETSPMSSPFEERVYNYIVRHEGVISLSKASADLGISVERLNQITEKLKKERRLA